MDLLINGTLTECSIPTVITFLKQDNANIKSLTIILKEGIGRNDNFDYLMDLGECIRNNTVLEELALKELVSITVDRELDYSDLEEFFSNISENKYLKKFLIDWQLSDYKTMKSFHLLKKLIYKNYNLLYFGNGKISELGLAGYFYREALFLPLLTREYLDCLDLSGGNISKNCLDVFFQTFDKHPQFAPRILNLSGALTTIYMNDIESLTEIFGINTIERIDLSHNEFSGTNSNWIHNLAEEILDRDVSLVSLNLGSVGLICDKDVIELTDIWREFPKRVPAELILSNNDLTACSLQAIAQLLALVESPLSILDLSGNSICQTAVLSFVHVFEAHPQKVPKTFLMANDKTLGNHLFSLANSLAQVSEPILEFNMSQKSLHTIHNPFYAYHTEKFCRFLDAFESRWQLFPKRIVMDNIVLANTDAICNLLSMDSSLESLSWVTRTEDNQLNDDDIVNIAASLKNNQRLEELILRPDAAITLRGWKSVADLICNLDGGNETFSSNHTLRHFSPLAMDSSTGEVADRISYCLELNSHNNDVDCGKLKVMKYHFATNFSIEKYSQYSTELMVELCGYFQKWMPVYEKFESRYFQKMRVLKNRERRDYEDLDKFSLTYCVCSRLVPQSREM